jgi:hypothetical protein
MSDQITFSINPNNRMNRILRQLKNKLKSYRFKLLAILSFFGISAYGKKVLSAQSGNNKIGAAIITSQPFLAARIGSVELNCLYFYLSERQKLKTIYPDYIRKTMENNAGFFPTDDACLDKFCNLLISDLKEVNLMGVWYNKNEDYICRKLCPNATLSDLACLEPYYHKLPWSRWLAGKKVLVVHPCSQSITLQYKNNRENIFINQSILPQFDLSSIRAVQSAAGEKTEFKNWFVALDNMKEKISQSDFDVAIIGAGAYGLSLAAYVKKLGKKAIHLGGATQILFGIKGKRWDNFPKVFQFYNKYWVRPLPEETPEGAKKVEGGCYW